MNKTATIAHTYATALRGDNDKQTLRNESAGAVLRGIFAGASGLGIATAAGLALSLTAAPPAHAGACVETSPGVFHCSSIADRDTDRPLEVSAGSGETLTVNDRGFSHNTRFRARENEPGGQRPALRIIAEAGSNGGSAVFDGHIIQSGETPPSGQSEEGYWDVVEVINRSSDTLTATFNDAVHQLTNPTATADSNKRALHLVAAGAGDLDVNINGVAVSESSTAITADNTGASGDINLTIGRGARVLAALMAPADGEVSAGSGIDIDLAGSGSGDLAIANHGSIQAERGGGINIEAASTGSNVSITNAGSIASGDYDGFAGSGEGIRVVHAGSGNTVIESTGAIATGNDNAAIHARSTGSGDIEITAGGTVTGDGAGIHAQAANGGITITLNTGVRVTGAGGADSDTAIQMTGGVSQRLVLNPGFRVSGDISADGGGSADLELTGATGTGVLDLAAVSDLSGTLFKTGAGAWNVTTSADNGAHSFSAAEINAGTLVLRNLDLTVNGPLSIDSATLAFNPGDTASTLAVSGSYRATAGEGSERMVFNINFRDADGDGTADANLVTITGAVAGSTTIDLRVVGLASPEGERVPLVEASQTADDDFTLGEFLVGRPSINLAETELRYDTQEGVWFLHAVGRAAGSVAYEGYTTILTHLSQLPPMRARYANRVWGNEEGRGAWARLDGGQTEIVPTASNSNSGYDMQNARARFGLEFPVASVSGLAFGGHVWLGRSSTNVASFIGESKIETDGYAIAGAVNYIPAEGLYLDAQMQYAVFASDISANGARILGNHKAKSTSISAEIGYPVPMPRVIVTPQAQLTWSQVDFANFTDINRTAVSLRDGEALNGRIGLSMDGRWNETGNTEGGFHATAGLRAPLDGETSAHASDGGLLVSETSEIALDMDVGVSFLLQEYSAVAAEVGTSQGDELEEYRGSLGLRFRF